MALAGLLSAMREIILDIPEIPDNEEERKVFYGKKFANISELEVIDLAKIDPKKFYIYSKSIFSGEKGLLENNFFITLKLLKSNWEIVSDSEFNLFELVKDLHKKYPWKATSTVPLGENFIAYIKSELSQICDKVPHLVSIAELELIHRVVKKSPDDEMIASNSISKEALSALTVEQLMAKPFLLPSNVIFKSFPYDVVAFRSRYFADEKKVPSEVEHTEIYTACARGRSNMPKWLKLERHIYDFLNQVERVKEFSIDKLAEVYVGDLNEDTSEQEAFLSFISFTLNLLESGVIIVTPDI